MYDLYMFLWVPVCRKNQILLFATSWIQCKPVLQLSYHNNRTKFFQTATDSNRATLFSLMCLSFVVHENMQVAFLQILWCQEINSGLKILPFLLQVSQAIWRVFILDLDYQTKPNPDQNMQINLIQVCFAKCCLLQGLQKLSTSR